MIKNVNYGNTSKLSRFKDTSAQFIVVPCGRCSVCLHLKQQYFVQRIQMEALSHDFYMLTLTYNNESLKHYDCGDLSFAYADVSDWQKMIKMIRKHEDLPPFKYFLVSEYGGKRHRPHFHAILSFPKDDTQTLADRWSFEIKLNHIFMKNWRTNVGSSRKPIWKPLFEYHCTRKRRNFDLHYCDPSSSTKGLDDVAFYVSKYVLKFDKWADKFKAKLYFNLPEDEYKEALKVFYPKKLISKGFGSISDPKVYDHLVRGIELALADPNAFYPYFISPVDGSTYPLSPYYSSKLLTFQDLDIFNSRKPLINDNDAMIDSYNPDFLYSDVLTKENAFEDICNMLDSRHTYEDDEADGFNDFTVINNEKTSRFSADVFNPDDFERTATTDSPSHADA